MESLNRAAVELVDEAIDFADELGIAVRHLENDAVVLDFGVDADGGIEAGLLLAEIRTGGLATVETRVGNVAGAPRTHVELSTDHPFRSLLCAGRPAWDLSVEGFEAGGSGPAQALLDDAGGDADEDADFAVLAVEAGSLPAAGVADRVAARTGVPTSGVFLPTAPVASIAGGVSMAARAAEAALSRLAAGGDDPRDVLSIAASAPVAPVADDEPTAVERSTAAIAHGGRVHLVVEEPVDDPDGLVSSPAGELAPAAVTVDVRGGPSHRAGRVDEDALAARLRGCD